VLRAKHRSIEGSDSLEQNQRDQLVGHLVGTKSISTERRKVEGTIWSDTWSVTRIKGTGGSFESKTLKYRMVIGNIIGQSLGTMSDHGMLHSRQYRALEVHENEVR
jgi:hypothetical protein